MELQDLAALSLEKGLSVAMNKNVWWASDQSLMLWR
jgi:hypothetical protein